MPIDHAHYALYITLYFLLMRMTGLVRVGKGHRHNMSIMQMQGMHGVGYVLLEL